MAFIKTVLPLGTDGSLLWIIIGPEPCNPMWTLVTWVPLCGLSTSAGGRGGRGGEDEEEEAEEEDEAAGEGN